MFASRPPAHACGDAEDHVVNLLTAGAFRRRSARGDQVVDPQQWAFYDRGRSYEQTALEPTRRRGVYLRLHPDLLREMLAELGARGAEAAGVSFPVPTLTVDVDLLRRWHQVQARVQARELDRAETEEALLLLAGDLLSRAVRAEAPRIPAVRLEAARAVQAHLAGASHRSETLHDLGAAVGLSGFQLARAFRALTGRSVHRYREGLRLHRAAAELQAHRRDLASLALELGYASHSHFTARFHRYFGTPPSAFPG